jgi:hypothetical protein
VKVELFLKDAHTERHKRAFFQLHLLNVAFSVVHGVEQNIEVAPCLLDARKVAGQLYGSREVPFTLETMKRIILPVQRNGTPHSHYDNPGTKSSSTQVQSPPFSTQLLQDWGTGYSGGLYK